MNFFRVITVLMITLSLCIQSSANNHEVISSPETVQSNDVIDYNPTISIEGNNLNIKFSHNLENLQRVIDVNGEGPNKRYIIRFAPSIVNSQNQAIPVNGISNELKYDFDEELDISNMQESETFTIEVYDTGIDYADPMSFAEPKGKGSVVVNDNTSGN